MGGMTGGVGGSFKKEGVSVYLWPIHIAVWKKSIQHWKAIILQLKMSFLKAKKQAPPPKNFFSLSFVFRRQNRKKVPRRHRLKLTGKNTGLGSQSLLQGIFLTQGSNLGLLHCRQIPYHLSHKGSPQVLTYFLKPMQCTPPSVDFS